MSKKITSRRLKRSQVKPIRERMLRQQGGICPLCEEPIEKDMEVLDHDHADGYVRGVLCRNCNSMEGQATNRANRAKRNLTVCGWLKNLIVYLEKHAEPQTPYIYPSFRTEAEKRSLYRKRAARRRAKKKKKSKKSNKK